MAVTNAKYNLELQEDREQWLNVFCPLYVDEVSMQTLQELHPDFVLSIYLQFVKLTLNASLDNLKQILFNCGEDMLKYPEAYEKSILMPRVAKLMSWFFLKFFGDHSFTFADLMAPKPSRTRYFFNCICQFVIKDSKAKEKRDIILIEVERKKEHLQRRQEQQNEIRERSQQLKNLRAERIIKQEQDTKCQQELLQEMERQQVRKAAIRATVAKTKQICADLRSQQLKGLNLAILELQEQSEQLVNSVVSDEELSELQQREQRLQQLQHDNADKKEQLGAVETLLASKEHMLNLFTNHFFKQVEELQHQLNQVTSISATDDVDLGKSSAISSCEELDHQLSVLGQKVGQLEEKGKTCKLSWTKKKEGIEAEMQGQRELREQLRKEHQEHDAEEKGLNTQLESCVHELDTTTDEFAVLDNYCESTYRSICAAMEKHNLKTEEALHLLLDELKKEKEKMLLSTARQDN